MNNNSTVNYLNLKLFSYPFFVWEQRKLGTAIKIIKDKNKNQHSYRAFSISNIKGFIAQDEQFGKDNTYSKTDKSTNYIVKPGMFAYNPARINVGSIAYQNQTEPVLVSSLYEIFQTNSKIDDSFLMNWFKTSLFNRQIKRLEEGGVRQYFFIDKMKETEIKLPSISEQNQISKLLQLVNKNLDLQQRKLKDIQLLKKAYLKAIFKSNKSTYKLKDIADYRRGSFPQPYGNPKWYGGDGSLPFVQVIDVAKNLRLYNSTKQRISRLAQSKSVFVPKGSILITLQGSIGKVAITQYDAFVDRTLLIISNLKKDVDKYYFAYALQDKFNEEKRKAPGGTIKTITKNALSEFQIKLPKKDIQKKQSSILQKIDKDIYIINLKLSELSKFKQFLLQNMFI
nr:restriction endonuclease subunit S [Lactobacillus gallinarum]